MSVLLTATVAGCTAGKMFAASAFAAAPAGHAANPSSATLANGGPLCIGGSRYAVAQHDEFATDTRLSLTDGSINANPAPPAFWSTQFPWGRTNNDGIDDALYGDATVFPYVDPFSIGDGQLTIKAQPLSSTDLMRRAASGRHWVSGTLVSRPMTYGYIEFSAKLPDKIGLWPALWLVSSAGADGRGNGFAEFDVAEVFGPKVLGPHVVKQTLVHNQAKSDVNTSVTPPAWSSDVDGDFHTYSVLWTAADVTFYIDRVPTSPKWSNAATGPMNAILTLQVYAQGVYGSYAAFNAEEMDAKYFRWYQKTSAACGENSLPPARAP